MQSICLVRACEFAVCLHLEEKTNSKGFDLSVENMAPGKGITKDIFYTFPQKKCVCIQLNHRNEIIPGIICKMFFVQK